MAAVTSVIQNPSDVLRAQTRSVAPNEIGSSELEGVIERMREVLAVEKDGVAIAAPQIGELLAVFIVSGKVFGEHEPDRVFINPELIKTSRKKEPMHEGCLSVRGLYGTVLRSLKARVRALDEHGRRFTLGGSGLLAQIFQHEIEHLRGILFIDTATELERAEPEAARSERTI